MKMKSLSNLSEFRAFTIELYRYTAYDAETGREPLMEDDGPMQWSRHWYDPTEQLNIMYKEVLKQGKRWHDNAGNRGARIDITEGVERLTLKEFLPSERY